MRPETPGVVTQVAPDSVGAALGLRAGDEVLQVNGEYVEDVIDVLFHAAEDSVSVEYRRDGLVRSSIVERSEGQPLGIDFKHPTFDTDIRRCNNLCPFCFVLQTAPRMRRSLYIKDDDYRYSFLYGHFVTLTNLDEHDWARIETQRLSPLYVSVHATNIEIRRECLRNKNASDVIKQLQWLGSRGIECHTQIVVTPDMNDGAHLKQSVFDLAALYPTVKSVSVVPVGLTKHHKYDLRANTRDESERVLENVNIWQSEFRNRLGAPFVHATDEWYLVSEHPVPMQIEIDGLDLQENGLGQVRGFLDAWEQEKAEMSSAKAQIENRSATLVSGTLFGPILQNTANEFNEESGCNLFVKPIHNEKLGDGITVAGLLMGADVIAQLEGMDLGEAIILPRVMFDHPQGLSLDDLSPLDIAQALGILVYLADLMGDVLDALSGRNLLGFRPGDPAISADVMHAGGWSLEKYL